MKTNGYTIFTLEHRDNPNATFGEIASKTGKMWTELSSEQKTEYCERAKIINSNST